MWDMERERQWPEVDPEISKRGKQLAEFLWSWDCLMPLHTYPIFL